MALMLPSSQNLNINASSGTARIGETMHCHPLYELIAAASTPYFRPNLASQEAGWTMNEVIASCQGVKMFPWYDDLAPKTSDLKTTVPKKFLVTDEREGFSRPMLMTLISAYDRATF